MRPLRMDEALYIEFVVFHDTYEWVLKRGWSIDNLAVFKHENKCLFIVRPYKVNMDDGTDIYSNPGFGFELFVTIKDYLKERAKYNENDTDLVE